MTNTKNEGIDKALQEKIDDLINDYRFDMDDEDDSPEVKSKKTDKLLQQIIHTVTQHNVKVLTKEYRERLIEKIDKIKYIENGWVMAKDIEQIIQETLK